jgi:hypothetical protein
VDTAETGVRVLDRLTVTSARGATTTGFGFGLGLGLGLGLTTPVKAIAPKVRGASGAWAAAGAAPATATARATGAVVLTWATGVVADAGRAREATIAPEMTITAEVLVAGLAEREMADEKDDAELKGLGARWRPEIWLDTVKKPLQTPTRSAVGFGREIAPGPHADERPQSSITGRASPQGASLDAPDLGPPLLPSGC